MEIIARSFAQLVLRHKKNENTSTIAETGNCAESLGDSDI
jgi:hypothetical protein